MPQSAQTVPPSPPVPLRVADATRERLLTAAVQRDFRAVESVNLAWARAHADKFGAVLAVAMFEGWAPQTLGWFSSSVQAEWFSERRLGQLKGLRRGLAKELGGPGAKGPSAVLCEPMLQGNGRG